MIKNRTITPVVGASAVAHHSLQNVRILAVDRTGLVGTDIPVIDSPDNDEFEYFAGGGAIIFDPDTPFAFGEKVLILYK